MMSENMIEMMNNEWKQKLDKIVGEMNVKILEPMSKHTTFRIGGPADYYVTPKTQQEVVDIIKLCQQEEMPYYVIGNGSNLLVGDYGYRGVIIQIGNQMSEYTIKEIKPGTMHVTAGAGILLSRFAIAIANNSLQGFEFASGIPGTLGGAVAMNAGAYGGEIKDFIVSAVVVTNQNEVKVLSKEELELGYRTSVVQTKKYIVVEATFEFTVGDKDTILASISEFTQKRKEKQPLEFPSAGSTFKRPVGYYAGKLIMDAKLAGFSVGNIQVSQKHCGFVINTGGGTAKEVIALIDEVRRRVYEQFGVNLEPEVRMIGEFTEE